MKRDRHIVVPELSCSPPSAFLLFAQDRDSLLQSSESSSLSFLRVEMVRIREGMSDFLLRVATPKFSGNRTTVITLRLNRNHSKLDGASSTASVIAREMSSRGDTSFDWDSLDTEHLGKMLLPRIKYFSSDTQLTLLRFTTDALS